MDFGVGDVGTMKIAVTGSSGMLGRALVKKLLARGNKVIECDKPGCDILDTEKLQNAFAGAEIVVHLAAKLDEDAQGLYEANVKGTENCLEAAAQAGARQFIFLSTVGVYGDTSGTKEEGTPPKPETGYEKSKLDAERKVLSYQEVFHVTVLRSALVAGNNEYWKGIIKTVKKGFPLIGSGSNGFQLVCAEDVVDAIRFCIGREECYGETFLVAEPEETAMTLEGVVNHIRKELGMHGTAKKIPLVAGGLLAHINSLVKFDPILKPAYLKRMLRERSYSTAKLEALGWKAQHTAKEGISELVAKFLAEKK